MDLFYNEATDIKTFVNMTADGLYLLDINNDSEWDYLYDPSNGTILSYTVDNGTNILNTITFMVIII